MIRSLDQLIPAARRAVGDRPPTMAVAQANDPHVEEAVAEAERLGLVKGYRITRSDPAEAAREAVAAVRAGEAQLLMKGLLQTADLLRAVMARDTGLRTGRSLSHACVVQVPGLPRLLHISDIALNIAPDLARKADIVRNQVAVARALGLERPKVAIISAIENVNPDMPATVDARALQEMAERGDLGECVVQGPLALDLALSAEAGAVKGVSGPVVGAADVLIMPNLETGNVLYKALVHLAGASSAGIVVGARCPIVLLSRSDQPASKLNSIALAVLAASA